MINILQKLNDFKRHYHRTRKLREDLLSRGPLGFRLSFNEEGLSSQFLISDKELGIRFSVLMRRFIGASSDLYLPDLWDLIKVNFKQYILDSQIESIDGFIENLCKGPIGLVINDKQLSAKDIYDLISDADLFSNDEDAYQELQTYFEMPFVGQLFWSQFFTFTINNYILASKILDLLLALEEEVSDLSSDSEIEASICIYCLSSNGPFISEEHIIPEALGYHDAILPAGCVCDACNSQILSRLDNYLINFEPVSLLRVYFVPHTKSGQYPRANFQNISIERKGPRHLELIPKDHTGDIMDKRELGDGWISWTTNFRGKPLDIQSLGRSLYKTGLGFIALKQGPDFARNARYDPARSFIRSQSQFPNKLLLSSRVVPHAGFQAYYRDLSSGTPFALDLFGIIFMFNLEPDPQIEPNEWLKELGFLEFDLSNKDT